MRSLLLASLLCALGPAAQAQAPVFRLNYLPGVRYVLTQQDTTETRMTLGLPAEMGGAQETLMRQVGRSVSDLSVEAEGDSVYRVTVTLRRTRTWQEHNGQVQVIDSDSAASAAGNPLDGTISALVGQPIQARVGRDGRVREVFGLDSLVRRMTATMPPELQQVMRSGFDRLAKSMVGGMYTAYPNAAVQTGETWTSVTADAAPFPIESRLTYTLDRVEDGSAHVRYEGTMATPADAPPMGEGPFAMLLTLTGTVNGTWVARLDDGTYVITSRSQSEGSGAPSVATPGMPPLTMGVTTRTSGRTEVTRATP